VVGTKEGEGRDRREGGARDGGEKEVMYESGERETEKKETWL